MNNQKVKLGLLLIMIIGFIFNCTKDDDGFTLYTVPTHEHDVKGIRFHPYNKKSLDFEFKTNDTWIWEDMRVDVTFGGQGDSTGWSKITGIGWMFDHQENRCELGYKYDDPYMVIGGYANADGVPYRGVIDTIQIDRTYFCRISLEDGWVIRINGKEWKCPSGKDFKIGVRLNPFVGGSYTIGHPWKVLIKKH